MLRALKIAFAALMLLCSGICFAEDGKSDQELVRTLMQKSGLSRQIEQIPVMMQADIIKTNQESGDKMSQSEMDDLGRMVSEAFNAKVLIETVQRHIQANLSGKDMRAVLAWIGSDLGSRITKLEEEASTAQAYEEEKKSADKLSKDSGRAELVAKLDKAVKATDVGVSISINLQVAFVLAITAEMPVEQRPSTEDILREVSKDREQLRENISQETISGFLYTYRSLKKTEIEQYIQFAESESGKRYHTAAAEGLNTALMQAGLALGSKVSRGLNRPGENSF
jgi:hypothetical protein